MDFVKFFIKRLLSFAVIYKMPDKSVYLTFDDGPHPVVTERILDILQQEQIKATFFIVGDNVNQYQNIIKRIAKEGHSIGYHTKNHKTLNEISIRTLQEEISYMKNGLLSKIAKKNIMLFRPPHGKISVIGLLLFYFNRIKIIQWSIDSRDSHSSDISAILDTFKQKKINGGEIILFHDDEEHTPELVKRVIEVLRNNTFKAINVG